MQERGKPSPHPVQGLCWCILTGIMINLHTHITASHGRRTPTEAVREAVRLGLDALIEKFL